MKLGVFDPVGNPGGGSRVIRSLLPAIAKADPGITVSFFANPAALQREGLSSFWEGSGIQIRELVSLKLASGDYSASFPMGRAIRLLQTRYFAGKRFLPLYFSGDVRREIEVRSREFDVLFFPWPFLMECPDIAQPAVGIFHDFNFRYYFGGTPVFSVSQTGLLEREMPRWLNRVMPALSTRFMKSELEKFYPSARQVPFARVIPLPVLSAPASAPSPVADADEVRRMGIDRKYVLCPTHLCGHKNLGTLIAAFGLLKMAHPHLLLVLTGTGTEAIRGVLDGYSLQLTPGGDLDVMGLGYVSNQAMDALIQRAAVVVNPSLYEAGNGPGLDAWAREVPVAMSNIPPFVEHLTQLGVKAQLFDPLNPQDIAEQVGWILKNEVEAGERARISRCSMQGTDWDSVARAYIDFFRFALVKGQGD